MGSRWSVLVPLVGVLGARWGATGAAFAVLDLERRLLPRVARAVPAHPARAAVPSTSPRRACAARAGAAVKVLIVSGIWPPDVGGPASHAPEVARFLHERGHEVEVVTTADAPPAARPYPVRWVRGAAVRACVHVRRRRARPATRARGRRRLHDRHVRAQRRRRAALARRPTSSSSLRIRRSSERGDAGSWTGTSTSSRAAAAARRSRCSALPVTSSCGTPRTCSRRARISASSPSAGASRPTA